jgi:hypothetical protein
MYFKACINKPGPLQSMENTVFVHDGHEIMTAVARKISFYQGTTQCSQYKVNRNNHSQSYFTADSQSVYLGVEPTLGTFDQILLPFQEFGSGICFPVSVGRPL